MPGKAIEDPQLTQEQEIAQKKQTSLIYFRNWPVKTAATDSVNRSSDAIGLWLK